MASGPSTSPKKSIEDSYAYFFSIFFWDEDRPKWFQYLCEVLSNLQLMAILLYASYLPELSPTTTMIPDVVRKLAVTFSLLDVFPDLMSWSSDAGILSIICIYFVLFLAAISYFVYNYIRNFRVSNKLRVCFSYWAQLHHTIFFWVLNIILLSSFHHNNILSTSTSANQKVKDADIAVSLIMIILNHLFAISAANFCYDPFMSKNVFGSYTSVFQRITCTHKILLCPLLLFISDKIVLRWIIAGLNIVFTLIRHEILFQKMPYYKYPALKLTSLMASSAFAISLTNLVVTIVGNYTLITPFAVVLMQAICIVLLLQIITSRLKRLTHYSISMPVKSLKTKEDMFSRIFALTYFANTSAFSLSPVTTKIGNQSLLYMIGDFSSHIGKCSNDKCLCRYLIQGSTTNDCQNKNMFEILKNNAESKINLQLEALDLAVKALRKENIFKIQSAYLLAKQAQSFSLALSHLFSLHEQTLTVHHKVVRYHLTQTLEGEMVKFFNSSEEKGHLAVNLKKTVDAEKRLEQLFTLIAKNTQSYLTLWEYFQQGNISLSIFLEKSIIVEKDAKEVQRIWDALTRRDKYLSKYAYVLYTSYLSLVRNVPSKGDKTYMKYTTQERKPSKIIPGSEQGDDRNDIMFYISLSHERLGRVLHVSRNVYEELGWVQADIINHNIKKIQAPFIKEKHDQILLNHINGAKKSTVAYLNGFAQTCQGYIVPIHASITIFPYVAKEPIYAGIVRKKTLTSDILIVRDTGFVDSFSEGVGKMLDLVPNEKIHLSQFCIDYDAFEEKLQAIRVKGTPEIDEEEEFHLGFMLNPLKNNSSFGKEVVYRIKAQILTLLGESCLCLYLYDHKVQTRSPRSNRSPRQASPKGNNITITSTIDFMVPEERAESPTNSPQRLLFNQTKTVESVLLSPNAKFNWNRKSTLFNSYSPKNEETQALDPLVSPMSVASVTSKNHFMENVKPNEEKKSWIIKDIAKNGYQNILKREGKIKASAAGGSITSSERRDANGKLEQAIHMVPAQRSLRILNYFVALFAGLCLGLIIFHMVDSYDQLGVLLQKIELIASCQRRTYSLVSSNINARALMLISMGIISETRQIGLGITSWSSTLKSTLKTHISFLNGYNANLTRGLSLLEKDVQEKLINDYVTLTDFDEERQVSTFEVFTEISNADARIVRTNTSLLTPTNPTIRFILDNTLNDPLLASDRAVEVLSQDYEDHLTRIRNQIYGLLIGTVLSGACIVVSLILDTRKFTARRDLFIEMLLRIDEAALQNHMRIVSRFDGYLQKNTFNLQSYVDLKGHLLTVASQNNDPKAFRRKSRIRSKKDINFQIVQNLVLTIVAILVFISAFMVLAIMFTKSMQQFSSKRERMIKTNNLRIDMILGNACVLAYISEQSTTTVRNQPLVEQLQYIFDLGRDFPQFLNSFLDDTRGMNGTLMEGIIHGDMCTALISLVTTPVSLCQRLTQIIGGDGLIITTRYFQAAQEQTVQLYNASNKTIAAAFEAYAIKGEIISEQISTWTLKGAETLENLFKEDLRYTVTQYRAKVIRIIVIYTVVYVLLGAFLSIFVIRKIRRERRAWRRILRQIPLSIILSNKPLKNFIINDCDHMLDSFKNII